MKHIKPYWDPDKNAALERANDSIPCLFGPLTARVADAVYELTGQDFTSLTDSSYE